MDFMRRTENLIVGQIIWLCLLPSAAVAPNQSRIITSLLSMPNGIQSASCVGTVKSHSVEHLSTQLKGNPFAQNVWGSMRTKKKMRRMKMRTELKLKKGEGEERKRKYIYVYKYITLIVKTNQPIRHHQL
jgi:hypothetical protein